MNIKIGKALFFPILFFFFFFFTFFSFTTAADTIDPSLVGLWHFDEGSGTTATDSSESGNTGTLINGPVWTTGKVGGALSFDGTDDYVSVPDSDSLDITNQLTIDLWVKPQNTIEELSGTCPKGSWKHNL